MALDFLVHDSGKITTRQTFKSQNLKEFIDIAWNPHWVLKFLKVWVQRYGWCHPAPENLSGYKLIFIQHPSTSYSSGSVPEKVSEGSHQISLFLGMQHGEQGAGAGGSEEESQWRIEFETTCQKNNVLKKRQLLRLTIFISSPVKLWGWCLELLHISLKAWTDRKGVAAGIKQKAKRSQVLQKQECRSKETLGRRSLIMCLLCMPEAKLHTTVQMKVVTSVDYTFAESTRWQSVKKSQEDLLSVPLWTVVLL